jgi:gas vesicle protein
MKVTFKKLALGTALAAVVGYVAGILTAPKSGKETREDIKHATKTTIAEAEKHLKQLHTQMTQVLAEAQQKAAVLKGKALEELNAAISIAKNAKEKAREILSAVHEGQAGDKELKKAIADGSKALEHLKKFLKA